jgi:hypothetical protein
VAVPLYLDADSCWDRLIDALVRLGFDVARGTLELPIGALDESHLARATELDRVLVTANRADFSRLQTTWAEAGRGHPGIVVWDKRRSRSPEVLAEDIAGALEGLDSATLADSIRHV